MHAPYSDDSWLVPGQQKVPGLSRNVINFENTLGSNKAVKLGWC